MSALSEVLRLKRPLIGVDLETTGVNPKVSGIVELGLEIMRPGHPVKEYRTYVNPLMSIPPEATHVHGITDDTVRDAPTFRQLADNLIKGFAGADFVGYNVRFDLRQLAEEFARAGHEWDYAGARVICAYRLWQISKPRTLEHAAKEYGVDLEDAHSALADVKAATRVIAAQLQRHASLPRDLDKLHALCWPDWYDPEGKLRWANGELCFTFGEHRDKPLRHVPQGYLNWILKKDFGPLVKETCRNALRGIYPVHVQNDPGQE